MEWEEGGGRVLTWRYDVDENIVSKFPVNVLSSNDSFFPYRPLFFFLRGGAHKAKVINAVTLTFIEELHWETRASDTVTLTFIEELHWETRATGLLLSLS